MKTIKTTLIASVFLIGCADKSPSKSEYKEESITEGGSYELRAFLSQDQCYAERSLTQTGSDESVGLLYSIASPLLSGTLSYGFKVISKIGNSMSKPYSMKAYVYPDKASTILDSQCLTLIYGKFGGPGKNNLNSNSLPYSAYNVRPINEQLTSQLGFATQIKIEQNDNYLTFTPYTLFYPKQLRPFGINKYHGISINIEFEKGNSLSMDFDKLYTGEYYNHTAIYSHGSNIEKSKVTPYNVSITVTEGPDNETLADLLKSISSDTVSSAESQVLKSYIDKKISKLE